MADGISIAEFQSYLRSGLEAKGWTAYRLAKEIGISKTLTASLLRGENQNSVGEATIRRIAEVLDLDGDWLVIHHGSLFAPASNRRRISELLLENRQLRLTLEGRG